MSQLSPRVEQSPLRDFPDAPLEGSGDCRGRDTATAAATRSEVSDPVRDGSRVGLRVNVETSDSMKVTAEDLRVAVTEEEVEEAKQVNASQNELREFAQWIRKNPGKVRLLLVATSLSSCPPCSSTRRTKSFTRSCCFWGFGAITCL